MIVFGTAAFLKYLTSDKIFGDGTFDQCPALFKQLYTIHGFKVVDDNTKQIMPCVYALLPDAKRTTYQRLLQAIKGKLQLIHGINWLPQYFQIDFEQPMKLAIDQILGPNKVKGCLFHYAQAVRRNAERFHLKE